MKTPQRRFVVEFKSGRRQSKAQTNSIWGDTDLKALAREVEETASHLFNSNGAPTIPDPAEITSADPVNARERAGTEAEMPKQHEDDRPAAEAVVHVQESQPVSQPRTTSRGTPRKRAKRAPAHAIAHSSMTVLEDESGQPQTATDLISFDEVAALDIENKRLKRLLAEQLRLQNLQLKKMLERFEVT